MRKITMIIFILLSIIFSCRNDRKTEYLKPSYWDKIFEEQDVYDYPIVFVHGIGYGAHENWNETAKIISGGTYFEMKYMENDIISHTYINEKPSRWVWDISFYTSDIINESIKGDLTLYSERVKKMIDIILKISDKKKVVIVAHSMGGLICRNYMVKNQQTWDCVHKIITVGTPNMGVVTSIGIVGQLRDLRKNSEYIKNLNKKWDKYYKKSNKKWGVIGGVDYKDENIKKKSTLTDSAGPGYIEISSAIPYNEWIDAMNSVGEIDYNTENFGFRSLVLGTHTDYFLMENMFEGILWLIKK